MRESAEGGCDFLHLLAVELAQSLEVRLDFLGDDACGVVQELQLLDIDFREEDVLDFLHVGFHLIVEHRHEHLRQRLAHIDAYLLAQCQNHRGSFLGKGHTLFQSCVDKAFVCLRHLLVVH